MNERASKREFGLVLSSVVLITLSPYSLFAMFLETPYIFCFFIVVLVSLSLSISFLAWNSRQGARVEKSCCL